MNELSNSVRDNEDGDVESSFRLFTRGLGQNSINEIYQAHRELYRAGESVVPLIRDYVRGLDLDVANSPIQANYVCGMFALLTDIDEAEAVRFGGEIIDAGCSLVISTRIRTITEFSLAKFRRHKVGEIHILESKRLAMSERRSELIGEWLSNVPEEDLAGITRIYIVSRKEIEEDVLGNYLPILFVISIKWWSPVKVSNILSWPFHFYIQSTFYHEIGHHVRRHTFGQDTEQEREANSYSDVLMRIAHPNKGWLISLLGRA